MDAPRRRSAAIGLAIALVTFSAAPAVAKGPPPDRPAAASTRAVPDHAGAPDHARGRSAQTPAAERSRRPATSSRPAHAASSDPSTSSTTSASTSTASSSPSGPGRSAQAPGRTSATSSGSGDRDAGTASEPREDAPGRSGDAPGRATNLEPQRVADVPSAPTGTATPAVTDPDVPFGPPLPTVTVVAAGTPSEPASTGTPAVPATAGSTPAVSTEAVAGVDAADAPASSEAPSEPLVAAPQASLVERTRDVVRDLGAPTRSFTIPSTLLAVLAAYLLSLRWLDRGGLPMARFDDGRGDDVQLVL